MSVKTAYVADNLEQHKDEILARWRNAATRQESAQSKRLTELDDKELLDHLPAIAEAMICVLRGENPSRIEDASRRHGHQRRLDGYSVLDVLWELTILRHVFLAVLREASEGVEEMAVDAGTKTILDVLDLCARASVGQHVKETEEERDVAAAKTADLEVQRQRFLGVLSHELRNQIQPILFGLQCLKDSNPSAQQMRAIEIIERQTRQQGLLLEDLLDLDRVRLGKIELNLSSVDLRECVRHGTESNQAQVNLKSLNVYQDFPEEPVYALVDRADGKVATAKNPRKWPHLFDFRANLIERAAAESQAASIRVTLPDGTMITSAQDNCDQILSRALAREVTLESVAGGDERDTSSATRTANAEEYWPDMEGLDFRDVGRVGAMVGGILLARQVLAFRGSLVGVEAVCRQARKGGPASNADGDLKSLVRGNRADGACPVERGGAIAAADRLTVLCFGHCWILH